VVEQGAVLGVVRCARDRRRRGVLRTLEGYLKAVDAKTGKELYKFKTPSGIIGNVTTYEQGGRQYVAVLSGVGGWAGIGLAAGLTDPTAGLGAVGGYAALSNYTALGGALTVFALPQ
jgi:lanthanide-dependent methanol dehydrogenase